MERRLEDRIRLLCQTLIDAGNDPEDFEKAAQELRSALREHSERVRSEIRDYPFGRERRVSEQ